MKKVRKNLNVFEIVWYCLMALLAIWGITYIVLGLVAQNLPTTASDDGLVKINSEFAKTFGLDFFGWGLIILVIAAVSAIVVLLFFAKKVDVKYEKETRRAIRLAQLEKEVDKEEGVETVDLTAKEE